MGLTLRETIVATLIGYAVFLPLGVLVGVANHDWTVLVGAVLGVPAGPFMFYGLDRWLEIDG